MTAKRTTVIAGSIVAVAIALAWYVVGGPRVVPPGQPPLVTLSAAGLAELRADFNRDADKVRVILLLSPT